MKWIRYLVTIHDLVLTAWMWPNLWDLPLIHLSSTKDEFLWELKALCSYYQFKFWLHCICMNNRIVEFYGFFQWLSRLLNLRITEIYSVNRKTTNSEMKTHKQVCLDEILWAALVIACSKLTKKKRRNQIYSAEG